MDDRQLDRDFRDVVRANNVFGVRVAALLAGVLVPIFGVLDYLLAPDAYRVLWTFRLVATVLTFAVLGLTFTALGRRMIAPLSSVLVLILAASIALMVRYVGGYMSPYYAGLNLVVLGAGFLFTWRGPQSVATVSAVIASFDVPALALDTITDVAVFVNNSFFLFATGILVVVGHIFNYRLKFREFRNAQLVLRAKQEIEEAHEKLKELDRFKSQFFANVTHELKTPLALILSPLDLLLQGELGQLSEAQLAMLRSMLQSGLKLLRQIGDLLDLSRLESSRLTLHVDHNDLAAFTEDLVEQVRPLADRKQLELRYASDVEQALVWCDIERVERVLLNLLSNALKFTPDGGRVMVSVRSTAAAVEIEVSDNGPGFPPELEQRVFERFFQVDMTGTRRHGGAGIGLALAREIVELHGGELVARSDVGQGATFTVSLSRDAARQQPGIRRLDREGDDVEGFEDVGDDEDYVEDAVLDWSRTLQDRDAYRLLDVVEATDRRVIERDPDEHLRAHTVLVVEDSPDVIRVIHLTLRKHFRVVAALDATKGLELALKEPPNLIITDLMMPDVDGLELTRRLRAEPRTRHIPIIMLTARGGLEDRVKGLEAGVNAYLAKPFASKELLTVVRSLLDIQEIAADILLGQRMESLQAVTGGLAHEINNPLNYIKNSLARVHEDVDTITAIYRDAAGRELEATEQDKLSRLEQRAQRMFKVAEAGVTRISATVKSMSRYSREGYQSGPQPHDLFAAAKEVIRIVLPATGREIEVASSFDGDGQIECVPEQVNQLLTNLVQNAIEAAPEEHGRVEVRGWTEGDNVCLTVEDNGAGIPLEVQSKVFTPFFTTKGPGSGMGLGLTICWRVVRSLNGTIHVEGEPGEGARFVVRLPSPAAAA